MQKKCFQTNRRLPYLLQIYNFCGWRMAKIEVQCVFLEMEHCAFPVFANDLLLQCTLYCLIHMPANSNQFSSSNKDVLGCGYAQTSCTSCVSWFELSCLVGCWLVGWFFGWFFGWYFQMTILCSAHYTASSTCQPIAINSLLQTRTSWDVGMLRQVAQALCISRFLKWPSSAVHIILPHPHASQ